MATTWFFTVPTAMNRASAIYEARLEAIGHAIEDARSALLPEVMKLVVRQQPDLSNGQAADVVVDTLLRGVGAVRDGS